MRQLAIPARRVLLVSLAECFVCSEHLGPLADVLQAHEQSDGTGQQRALLQICVLQSVLRCSGLMLRKCHFKCPTHREVFACMHACICPKPIMDAGIGPISRWHVRNKIVHGRLNAAQNRGHLYVPCLHGSARVCTCKSISARARDAHVA